MTDLRWTEQAVEDLTAIRDLIQRDSPAYGTAVALIPRSGSMTVLSNERCPPIRPLAELGC